MRVQVKGYCPKWHLLKPKLCPVYCKALMHPESDYGRLIWVSFGEFLDGCAAGGLLRKNFPQLYDLSRPGKTRSGLTPSMHSLTGIVGAITGLVAVASKLLG
jgi:hypothetical protein